MSGDEVQATYYAAPMSGRLRVASLAVRARASKKHTRSLHIDWRPLFVAAATARM